MTPFLGRTYYDEKTAMYSFADGSGKVPAEMKCDLAAALDSEFSGVSYLGTLFTWKDRLDEVTK